MARFTYDLVVSGFNKTIQVYDNDKLIYTGQPSSTASIETLISVAALALTDNIKVSVDELKRMEPRQKKPENPSPTNNVVKQDTPATPSNTKTDKQSTVDSPNTNKPPQPSETFKSNLKFGSKGDDVKKIQSKLGVTSDGFFGKVTLNAVKEFQTKNNLKSDGIVDVKTWEKLFPQTENKTNSVTGASTYRPFKNTVKIGDRNEDVRLVQQALVAKGYKLPRFGVDGIFKLETQSAVKRFQEDNNLTIDGIVGPDTWRRLFPPQYTSNFTGTQSGRLNLTNIDPTTNRLAQPTPFRGPTSSPKKTLNDEVKKRLEKLKTKILGTGIDILTYLLPDEEVAKNLMRDLNPSFSPEDLNIIVYGVSYNPNMDLVGNLENIRNKVKAGVDNLANKFDETKEQLKNVAENAKNQAESTLQNARGQVQGQVQNFSQGIRSQISNPDQFLQDQAKDAATRFGSGLANQGVDNARRLQDIASSGVTQSDILRSQARDVLNPTSKRYLYDIKELDGKFEVTIRYRKFDGTISEIGKKTYPLDYKQEVNGKVLTGKDNLEKVLDAEASKRGFFGFLKEEFPLPGSDIPSQDVLRQKTDALGEKADRLGQAKTRLEELKDQYSMFSPYPLTKDHPLYKNVKSRKDELRKQINKFFAKQEEIFNAFITSISQTSTAIPAITLLVSTPPFNVPAAISLATLVMAAINELVSKIPPILDYLQHIQDLSMFVSKKAYQELARLLAPVIEFLTRLLDPIAILKKFFKKILEALMKLFTSNNCRKQIKRINRDLRRKRRDFKNEKNAEEKEDIGEEIKELEDRLKETEKNCKDGLQIEKDMKDLNVVLNESNELSQELLTAVEEIYVYDVTLPDGQVLVDLTEEDIESLKTRYNVIVTG